MGLEALEAMAAAAEHIARILLSAAEMEGHMAAAAAEPTVNKDLTAALAENMEEMAEAVLKMQHQELQ